MKISKKNQNYINVVGGALAQLDDNHPEQTIQEQWTKWQDEGEFTYDRYCEFMEWRSEWLKAKPLD